MNNQRHSGINFGAGYDIPAERQVVTPAGADVDDDMSPADDFGGGRLQRRMARRSDKFKGVHKHRVEFVPNPFIVTLRDQGNSHVWDTKKGIDFVVMKQGATIDVEINDRKGHSLLFRRFLTPHVLSGGGHVIISNPDPDFLHRRMAFTITARSQGLVCILALDVLGRCRGELVISVKDFSARCSVQFVRVHNGEAGGKLKNVTTLTNAQINTMLQRADDLLRGQIGISFYSAGPPAELETSVDLSNGLPEPEFKTHFETRRHGNAHFAVYLFAAFKKPFLKSNDTLGAARMGQFVKDKFGVVALSDEATAKGRPYISLAHEICHTLIDPGHFPDLGFDDGGHYEDKNTRGLMRGGQTSENLRWRDVNVINPSGLGQGGLAGLKSNNRLWRDSGS